MRRERQNVNKSATAYLSGLPPEKRRPAARLLQLYVGEASTLDEFDWSSISRAALIHARSQLATKYSPSTVNSVLSCVRSVLRHGLRLGILPAHQYLDSLEVSGIDRERPTSSLELTPAKLALLFHTCAKDRQAAGRRDAFIFLMIACAGFNRRDIVTFTDLQPPRPFEGTLFLADLHNQFGPCSLLLGERGRDIVVAWINLRGTAPGPAVCPLADEATVLSGEPVSEQLTYRVIQKRAREAGLDRISTTSLKWYYRLHVPDELNLVGFLIPANFHRVLEPPEY